MAYTAAQQRRMAATEQLANQLATLRQEIESRAASAPTRMAMPQAAPLDTRALIAARLRQRPQDYKNLSPQMRAVYNSGVPRTPMASTEKYPDTQDDIDRKAKLARMALVGPTISEFGDTERMDTSKRMNQEAYSKAQRDARVAENARFSEGSAYQQLVAKRRALQEAAQSKNYSKNMKLAYARGVLRPGAVSLGVQQGILPDEQGMAAARAIAMIQAQHPMREADPLKSVIADRIKQDPGLLDRMYGTGGATPDQQPNVGPAGGAMPQQNGVPRLIEQRPDGQDVYLMPDGTHRLFRRGGTLPQMSAPPRPIQRPANPLDYSAPMPIAGG